MKKRIVFLLIAVGLVTFMFASGRKDGQNQAKAREVKISVLNGPSGVGLVPLFEREAEKNNLSIQMEVSSTPDVLLPKLIKGEIDMGILPPNAAAKVYNTSENIVLLAVVGKGMLNLLSLDTNLKTLDNLKGKKIFVAGQGSTPEYLLRFLASQSGIAIDSKQADSLELDFSIPTAELAAALASEKISYAFLPEPFASLAQINNPHLIRTLDIQGLYQSFTKTQDSYPMTVLVGRKSFVEENKDLVEKVLKEVAAAIDYTNKNPEKAGQLVEKYSLGLKAPIVTKSIPTSAFAYSSAADAKKDIEDLLSVFLDFAPEAIGGKLPDDSFYFN